MDIIFTYNFFSLKFVIAARGQATQLKVVCQTNLFIPLVTRIEKEIILVNVGSREEVY